MFDFDTFHMGADEVSFKCWDSSDRLKGQMRAEGLEPVEKGKNMVKTIVPVAFMFLKIVKISFWTLYPINNVTIFIVVCMSCSIYFQITSIFGLYIPLTDQL